mmetsp:Transcript_25897/g.35252  ORF Transcript_25897/g.35252 Transcript_25897/m.35252 type:complete len:95 (-) Transcript_25897:1957-2241(-)
MTPRCRRPGKSKRDKAEARPQKKQAWTVPAGPRNQTITVTRRRLDGAISGTHAMRSQTATATSATATGRAWSPLEVSLAAQRAAAPSPGIAQAG